MTRQQICSNEPLDGYQGFHGVQQRISLLRSNRPGPAAAVAAIILAALLVGGVVAGRITTPMSAGPAAAETIPATSAPVAPTEVCALKEDAGQTVTLMC